MKKFNTLEIRRERADEFYRGHDAYMAAAKRDFSAMAPYPGRFAVTGYLSDECLKCLSSQQRRAGQSFGGGL